MAESRQRSHLTRNLVIGFLILVVLYALAGFLLLPWWIERAIPEQLAQRMGWQSQIESVRVNPFALSVETVGLSAQDAEGESHGQIPQRNGQSIAQTPADRLSAAYSACSHFSHVLES